MAPVFQDAKALWSGEEHLFRRDYQGPGAGTHFLSEFDLSDVPRKNIAQRLWYPAPHSQDTVHNGFFHSVHAESFCSWFEV